MIAGIYHGYTKPENADNYEHMLNEKIFSSIQRRNIRGLQKIELLRRAVDDEVEFVTIMWFESIEAVKEFAGSDFEKSVVYPDAIALLTHYDKFSQHYKLKK